MDEEGKYANAHVVAIMQFALESSWLICIHVRPLLKDHKSQSVVHCSIVWMKKFYGSLKFKESCSQEKFEKFQKLLRKF